MSHTESMLFKDLIGGSYLWGGVLADVFVAHGLHNKQEGIKQRPRSIDVGLQWND